MAKTIDELKAAAAVVRDATEEHENTALRIGQLLLDAFETLGDVRGNAIKGYVAIGSVDDLPESPTAEQQQKGWLLGTVLYVWVGTGGDTLGGKYQSAQLKGADGAPGEKGDKGESGVHLGDVALVNDLTTGGEESALTAEMGKVLGERISAIKDCIFTKEDDALCIITDNYMERSTAPSIEVQQQSEGYLVTIVNHVNGARILYSTDGSVPGIVYDQPFTISTAGATTILATATEDGKLPSAVVQEIVVIVSSKVQAFCDRVLNDGGHLIFEDALGTQKAYSAHTELLGTEPELDFLGYKGSKLAPTYLYSMNENCDADQLTSVYISDDGLIVASQSQAGKAKTNIKWTRYLGSYSTRFAPDITWNQDGTRVVNRDFKRLYLHAKNGFLNYQGETQGTNVYENGILTGFPSRNGNTGVIGGQNDTIFVNSGQKNTVGAYSALNARTLFVKMADTGYAIEQVLIDGQAATSLGTTCDCGSFTGVGYAYMQMKENSPMLILAY